MKKSIISAAALALCSLPSFASQDWANGAGPINQMFVYPDYIVVEQGLTRSGQANCSNDNRWTLRWSDFSEADQQRIYSTLLTAYTARTPITAILDATRCGDENFKRSNGRFQLMPLS